METNDTVKLVFALLDGLNEAIDLQVPRNVSLPLDDFQIVAVIKKTDIKLLIEEDATKDIRFSNHGIRLTHFILYLNTEMTNCSWVKSDPALNLNRYVHGKPIPAYLYFKLVEIFKLIDIMYEVIMCTPYGFCRDLIEMNLERIKTLDGEAQLIVTENLILALFKSVKRLPPNSSLEGPLISNFNEAMVVFNKDYLPRDIRRSDFDEEQRDVIRYNGFRVKTIFKIFVELIKYSSSTDTYRQYPMYKFKTMRSTPIEGNPVFKKSFDVIMYKCMNMCDFSVSTWLSWYEIEVIDEDTNLQSAIGHLCFELCKLIDDEVINEPFLKEFKPILRNIAIEKIDFTNVNIYDIDRMVDSVISCTKFHVNDWIKKMIENTKIFDHPHAVKALDSAMDTIDYNCFKHIIDQCMLYKKEGGSWSPYFCSALLKGITHMDLEDKLNILKHVVYEYPEASFMELYRFDSEMSVIAHNEYSDGVDRNELMSRLVWLVLLEPKKTLHYLISQYITGICGLPAKRVESKRSILHQIMVFAHTNMHCFYIYQEYREWLSRGSELSAEHKQNLRLWIFGASRLLRLMKPKIFLSNVIAPILNPSSNYDHMLYLMNITKYFLAECQLISLPELNIWDSLLVRLATILDDARWTINNYSPVRAELCEKVIMTIQPLLHYANYIVKPADLEIIKQALSGMCLMTRNHFLRLWTSEYITVEGMDEQFIMTIQSQSHISFSNLNRSSTQKAQEEFIFSIATYMPKFTLYEMKSFLANYLSSAKLPNIFEASFFLFDCVMNALMRIIVYLKISVQNDPFGNECAWDYLENTIINFIDAVNTSKMCSIYDEEVNANMAFNTITKIIMVVKQMEDNRQMPLLVVIRRLIDLTIPSMDTETVTKLLTLIASIKSPSSKNMLGNLVLSLKTRLDAEQTPRISQSSQG